MLDKLHNISYISKDRNEVEFEAQRPPNNAEITDKINELVDAVNWLILNQGSK